MAVEPNLGFGSDRPRRQEPWMALPPCSKPGVFAPNHKLRPAVTAHDKSECRHAARCRDRSACGQRTYGGRRSHRRPLRLMRQTARTTARLSRPWPDDRHRHPRPLTAIHATVRTARGKSVTTALLRRTSSTDSNGLAGSTDDQSRRRRAHAAAARPVIPMPSRAKAAGSGTAVIQMLSILFAPLVAEAVPVTFVKRRNRVA